MSPEEMLAQLNAHGEEAGSDFNDADDVDGWFGWSLEGDVLTATYRPCTEDGRAGEAQPVSWRLVSTDGLAAYA